MTARWCGASPAQPTGSRRTTIASFNGQVQLRTALAHSYNVATARLGIALGVDHILDKLPQYGIERRPPPFASFVASEPMTFPRSRWRSFTRRFADSGFRTAFARHPRGGHCQKASRCNVYPLNVEPVAAARRYIC